MDSSAIYGIIFLVIMVASGLYGMDKPEEIEEPESPDSVQVEEKFDDWALDFNKGTEGDIIPGVQQSGMGVSKTTLRMDGSAHMEMLSAPSSSQNLGFSVGGAKDIQNFRDNIANGYLPLPSSITYEGLFYDHYFDTGHEESSDDEMFSPSYSMASIGNRLKEENELWLSVGLNSNIKESDFSRKKLNLVVVLDISGSMESAFDQYYYDGKRANNRDEDRRSKLTIAAETVCDMLSHLNNDDRFGMVVFENRAYLAKPLNLVGSTDMEKIRGHIKDLHTLGGTNMYAGMQEGTKLFDPYLNTDKGEYENRIIFLTDAMPNRELTDKYSLWGVLKENSEKGLYSTLIGVGVDFQSELVEAISKVEGANYYSIHTAADFKKRLDEEFDYMVTPLVFDLNLVLDAEGYEIVKVCGTPYSAESSGEIMKVGTLFPSASEDDKVRGGIILVQLKQTEKEGDIRLIAGYNDRAGKHYSSSRKVDMKRYLLSSYINPGIKKGVLLVHYADLLRDWARTTRGDGGTEGTEDDWQYNAPQNRRKTRALNEWEQESIPLSVNSYYLKQFLKMKEQIINYIRINDDQELQKEVELLDILIKTGEK